MQSPILRISRDGCDIESLRQQMPSGFKLAFLNAAAARGVKQVAC